MLDEKLKAKLEKKLAKWGIDKQEVVNDFLNELENDEEEEKTAEENVETPKDPVEEKHVDPVDPVDPDEVSNDKEKKTVVANETPVEPVVKDTNVEVSLYKTQIDDLNKKFDELKALLDAQVAKTNKAYEILDAQGKTPDDKDDGFYAKQLGSSDIRPNFNNPSTTDNDMANLLQHKKNR